MPRKTKPSNGSDVTIRFEDEARFSRQCFEVADHGMVLRTKWPFMQGTEIEVKVNRNRRNHTCRGIVVACQPHTDLAGVYDVTLYCIEPPKPAVKRICSEAALAQMKS